MSDSPDDLPFFYVDPRIEGWFTIQHPTDWSVSLVWGEATIQFHQDGRLTLEGYPTMDAAAQAFWQAVKRWAPAGMQVILPEGYGEG